MNKEEFINELKKINVDISTEKMEQLDIYCNFLLEYNKHTNLTAIKEEEHVYLKHFYDSLTLTKVVNLNEINTLIDIGTGAGFPGMVIKILFPNIKTTLLDSNNKKITFLKELSQKLNLSNINFYHGRAEDFCKENREQFDLVTARAVSDLSVLSELCIPLTKIDGYFVPLKGSNEEELENGKYAIETLGGKIMHIEKFKLPKEDSIRNILLIKKIKKTPDTYPRRYDKITNKPLKKNSK